MIDDKIINWFLSSPPWVHYRTQLDLLEMPESSPEVQNTRLAMLSHPQVQSLLAELSGWPGTALKRHNDASHLLHKLVFIADIGLDKNDPGLDPIIARILKRRSDEGVFQVLANISPHYGGTGSDQLVWMLCDTPSILYALTKLGLANDFTVQAAARHLAGLAFDQGFPCTVAPELGKFHGPGRKSDPCPYATLVTLKALAPFPEYRDAPACMNAAGSLLTLWQQRRERKPFLFGMGTDFSKLKLPFIWYDILHVTEILSQFPSLHQDPRFREMIGIIKSQVDGNGLYTPTSVWKAWSSWDFGQKKTPSPLLTFFVYRLLKRVGET
jgi:hypothetical protein